MPSSNKMGPRDGSRLCTFYSINLIVLSEKFSTSPYSRLCLTIDHQAQLNKYMLHFMISSIIPSIYCLSQNPIINFRIRRVYALRIYEQLPSPFQTLTRRGLNTMHCASFPYNNYSQLKQKDTQ